MLKKIFIPKLFIFIFTFGFIISASSMSCKDLEGDFYAKCNNHDSACKNLKLCQDLRHKCPQQIDEYASCQTYKDCISENSPPNGTNRNSCVYEWSTGPNQPGTCANTNRFLDSVAWRCPGFETYNDVFNDRNFNCDGHKGRYWNSHSECRQARAAYEKSIEEKRCQFTSNIPSVSTCKEAFNSVSFGDKEQGITKEIMDHSRDPNGVYNNIVEFQRAFYEDSDSASGASAK